MKLQILTLFMFGIVSSTAMAVATTDSRRSYVCEGVEFVTTSDISVEQLQSLRQHMRDVRGQIQQLAERPLKAPVIRVYLFDSAIQMAKYTTQQIPGLGLDAAMSRNGLFLFRKGHSYLFLVNGPLVAESLRHETTHAWLHSNFPSIPLWLDEGLAQCFEQTDGSHMNVAAQEILKEKPWYQRTRSVRQLQKHTTFEEFTRLDYGSAWYHTRERLRSRSVRLQHPRRQSGSSDHQPGAQGRQSLMSAVSKTRSLFRTGKSR